MVYPETLPCQCINPDCGISFEIPNMIGNIGVNGVFTDNKTKCPRCKQTARIIDFSTDSTGQVHFQQFFSYVKNIGKPETLRKIQKELEAANDSLTAGELADSLTEIDPGFSKYKDIIQSVPVKALPTLINLLVMIIMVVLTYQNLRSSNKNHDESIEVQKSQIELSREQFEYQKERDKLEDADDQQLRALELQIEELRKEFEQEINANKKQADSTKIKQKGKGIKGCDRNKPCPCGSGIKYKKCHPNGILV